MASLRKASFWMVSLCVGAGVVGCIDDLTPSDVLNTALPNLPADTDLATDGSTLIASVMIDAEQEDTAGLQRIANELLRRRMPATIYVTGEYANQHATLIQSLHNKGFEIAVHGYSTGEQLATMTYDEQKSTIQRALTAVSGCTPCGTALPVTGFRPQYFSQNADTFQILDELGLAYNSGFKAGHLPFAGREASRAPFKVDSHAFAAIPVTTVDFDGSEIYLCDISCGIANLMTGDQWLDALKGGLQRAQSEGVPFVANFHGWYTGDKDQYDYWPAFVAFLDQLHAANAVTVRSAHLAALFAP
jgi:peptidoglycan/xylan/chitin deacetylase (PgdA/CDA1 family)